MPLRFSLSVCAYVCMYVCMCMDTCDNVPIVWRAVAARITKISWKNGNTTERKHKMGPYNSPYLIQVAWRPEILSWFGCTAWPCAQGANNVFSNQFGLSLGASGDLDYGTVVCFFLYFYCFRGILQRCVTAKLAHCFVEYKTSADF